MGVFRRNKKDGTTSWYYDFMINNVRYRGVGGITKTQALRTQEKIREKVLNGEYDLVVGPNHIRIEVFTKTFLERRKQLRSWKRDELSTRNLLSYFRGKTMHEIKSSTIEDYIIKRKGDGVANATVNRELSCLRRMYNLAIKWGHARKNPLNDVEFLQEPPGRDRFLSKEEIQKLINVASIYLRPVIITALSTGMRLNEILNLTWDRVHISNVIDPYIELMITKNNKKRFIPLNEVMLTLLKDLKHTRNGSEYVFLNSLGEKYHHITHVFQSTLTKAKITNFRFHDLRHTFASHFIMNSGDLMTLKEILGHSTLKMVERYAHLAASHKRKQINNLNAIFETSAETIQESSQVAQL